MINLAKRVHSLFFSSHIAMPVSLIFCFFSMRIHLKKSYTAMSVSSIFCSLFLKTILVFINIL